MATYSFGPINGAVHVWNVERLWQLASELPEKTVPVNSIRSLDDVQWFGGLNGFGGLTGLEPTCRRVAEHAKRICAAQFDRPIILSATGHVMDGRTVSPRLGCLGWKKSRRSNLLKTRRLMRSGLCPPRSSKPAGRPKRGQQTRDGP